MPSRGAQSDGPALGDPRAPRGVPGPNRRGHAHPSDGRKQNIAFATHARRPPTRRSSSARGPARPSPERRGNNAQGDDAAGSRGRRGRQPRDTGREGAARSTRARGRPAAAREGSKREPRRQGTRSTRRRVSPEREPRTRPGHRENTPQDPTAPIPRAVPQRARDAGRPLLGRPSATPAGLRGPAAGAPPRGGPRQTGPPPKHHYAL